MKNNIKSPFISSFHFLKKERSKEIQGCIKFLTIYLQLMKNLFLKANNALT